ncbi:MAG: prepilin-type N-terminal cleavage/methylation domain-containing protein [Muribaculaceae bacterium]|nr:prepilin-type N-terminal cleavage/methylation domain-containing protein [Muribaculaceae bacterium]
MIRDGMVSGLTLNCHCEGEARRNLIQNQCKTNLLFTNLFKYFHYEITTHTTCPRNDNKIFTPAFTLAEVLITLGIIGVVAAMTIPNLMAKISEKRYQASYRKAYSTLNQALKSAMEDGVIGSTADGGYVEDGDGSGVVGKNFVALSTYFTGTTTCFENNADKCWECNGQAGLRSPEKNNGRGCNKKSYAFIDASGMQYYLYSNDEWPVLVDVNGFSGPNELGKDRYVVYFTNSKNKLWYSDDVDVIYPWKDVTVKQRWCPSGNCPNTSRLFGNGGNTLDYDPEAKN